MGGWGRFYGRLVLIFSLSMLFLSIIFSTQKLHTNPTLNDVQKKLDVSGLVSCFAFILLVFAILPKPIPPLCFKAFVFQALQLGLLEWVGNE